MVHTGCYLFTEVSPPSLIKEYPSYNTKLHLIEEKPFIAISSDVL